MMESARVIIEVVAGLIPNQPMEEYTKRFTITDEEWDHDDEKVMQIYGYANEYARTLWNPNRVNWVRMDWIWL